MEVGAISVIISVLLMKKLRHRNVKQFPQGHIEASDAAGA